MPSSARRLPVCAAPERSQTLAEVLLGFPAQGQQIRQQLLLL